MHGQTTLQPSAVIPHPVKDRHILIAIDESENAKRALLYVADFLGGQPGTRITLVSIIPQPAEDYFENDYLLADWLENQYKRIDEMLENYRSILLHSGFQEDKINKHMVINSCSSISECIILEQNRLGCCTIVIGRRGISRKEEFLFGSTSSTILHSPKNCAIWIIE